MSSWELDRLIEDINLVLAHHFSAIKELSPDDVRAYVSYELGQEIDSFILPNEEIYEYTGGSDDENCYKKLTRKD